MTIFYQVFAILMMAFLTVAIITAITTNPITVVFTIPFWPIAVFMFRLGKKAASLEEWLIITENDIVLRKKNFSYLKEWKIPIAGLKSVTLQSVGFWASIKNMSYFVKRRESENENALYPTMEYKEKGTHKVTLFENATDLEMKWVTEELQKFVPQPKS